MNQIEFETIFNDAVQQGQQQAKEAKEIVTLKDIFTQVASLFADRTIFDVYPTIGAHGEYTDLTIAKVEPQSSARFDFDNYKAISVRQNPNGTFCINSNGTEVYNERPAEDAVKAIGHFYGQFAKAPKL